MIVDYVRIYERMVVGAGTPVITPGRVVNASSHLTGLAIGSLAVIHGEDLAEQIYYGFPEAGRIRAH